MANTLKAFEKESDKALTKRLETLQNKLREHRFAVAGSKAKNPHEKKHMKKEIARILTELRAREINEK